MFASVRECVRVCVYTFVSVYVCTFLNMFAARVFYCYFHPVPPQSSRTIPVGVESRKSRKSVDERR